MVSAKKEEGDKDYISDLAVMCIEAHNKVGIGVKTFISTENFSQTYFENGDEVLIFDYENLSEIKALSKSEKEKYQHKFFFDYKLPEGAERAVIQQLGLLDYMVNIGICSEKSGGK